MATMSSAEPQDVAALLNAEVVSLLPKLEALQQHREVLGAQLTDEVLSVARDCRRRLIRPDLYVAVIGEAKSGKSTLLNALLGSSVLGVAVRECTGTVTLLKSGPRPQYCAILTGGLTEDFQSRCPDRYDELATRLSDVNRQIDECARMEESLPQLIACCRSQVRGLEQLVDQLRNDLATRECADAAGGRSLGDAEYSLELFAGSRRATQMAVPFCYRHVARWWSPWILLPRLFLRKRERPEWRAHLGEVARLRRERQRVRGMAKSVAAARRQTALTRLGFDAQAKSLADQRNQLAALEGEVQQLPGRKEDLSRCGRAQADELEAHLSDRGKQFRETVRELTDMERRGTEVVRLEIAYPGKWLPPGLVVMDTPGINTDNEVNRARAWEAIKHDADGCVVVSDIQQSVSESTQLFVREVRSHVPHLILLLTKVDQARESAALDDASPDEQVEQARLVGTARFAREVGRRPDEILSFAVAAQPALHQRSEWEVEKFTEDVRRLTSVLSHERTLMVASRCSVAARRAICGIERAGDNAETQYREKITALEEQQIDDPEAFCGALLEAASHKFVKGAAEAADRGKLLLGASMDRVRDKAVDRVLECSSWSDLKGVSEVLGTELPCYEQQLHASVRTVMEQAVREELQAVETVLLEMLQERYRIVSRLRGGTHETYAHQAQLRPFRLESAIGGRSGAVLGEIEAAKNMGTVAGATAGAVMGSVVPGLGTLVGGVVGGVVGRMFGPGLDKAKRACAAEVASAMDAAREQNLELIAGATVRMTLQMREAMAESLRAETRAYGEWIVSVIGEQRRHLEVERSKLRHLQDLRVELGTSEARLRDLHAEAMVQSVSLCEGPVASDAKAS